jgi:hypothetical protein
MSWFRRLPVVLVCIGVTPLHGRAEAAKPAVGLITVGCAKLGYTMRIPANWGLNTTCTPDLILTSADDGMRMEIKVESHAYWNAARTQSRLLKDVRPAPNETVDTGDLTYSGRTFHYGLTTRLNSVGTPLISTELIAFQSGNLYAFYAAYVAGTDPSTTVVKAGNGKRNDPNLVTDRQQKLIGAWSTIIITGPKKA